MQASTELPPLKTLLLGALLCASSAAAQAGADVARQQADTSPIALFTSFPFGADLVTAPVTNKIAWTLDQNGDRSICVAAPKQGGGFAVQELAHFNGDDGQEIGQLAWASDGATLLFARGTDIDGGQAANPNAAPEPTEAAGIWMVSTGGGAASRVATGSNPALSPVGRIVAYLAGGTAWLASLDQPGRAERIYGGAGHVSTLRWSPDGRMLAIVVKRPGQSLVGVFDVAAKRVRWMAPSLDTDREPAWSPDSRAIAWVRSNAWGAGDFLVGRENIPWSLWTADPATGQGHRVFTADAGPGSVFRALQASAQSLQWLADGRLVFPWEKSGWINLYVLNMETGIPTPLATGTFEVFSSQAAPDGKSILYLSNKGDLDRRSIGRLDLTGREETLLRASEAVCDAPAFLAGTAVAALCSDPRRPTAPALLSNGTAVPLVPESWTRRPGLSFTEPKAVVFDTDDGLSAHGQLFQPSTANPGERKGPAVLFFHGGPQRQMLLGWHPVHAYAEMYAFNQALASKGYTVLSVNYRGGTGYGLDFREAKNFGPLGASELGDIKAAGKFLAHVPGVDASRIGIYGGSYGGLMTALGLARAPELFVVGIDYAGIHDWTTWLGDLLPAQYASIAHSSSVASDIKAWKAPVLIAHSGDDHDVPLSQSLTLLDALRSRPVHVEQLVFPDERHDFLLARSWRKLFTETFSYFERYCD